MDDKLPAELSVAERPSVVWVKNLHSSEFEYYSGKIDRTSLSLWLQDRANRRIASPEKQTVDLSRQAAQSACTRSDNNYCVVGVYSSQVERAEYIRMFLPALQKYKDDPVNFYTLNKSLVNSKCQYLSPGVYLLRSKRGKYAHISPANTLEQVSTKVDAVLSGEMIRDTIPHDLIDCFI